MALITALAACGGGEKATVPDGPGPVASITIAQATLDTLSELASRQLTITGADAKGRAVVGITPSWRSSDSTIASVSGAGVVVARQPGTATISAQSGAASGSLTLHVVAVPVRELTVRLVGALSADTILVGSIATLVVEARDIGGALLLGRSVTVSVADTARGAIDANGRLVARAEGPLALVLTADTVVRRRSVIVRPPLATALAVRLADPRQLHDTLWVGLRDSVVATFADASGKPLAATPLRPLSYGSSDTKVATVDGQGRVQPAASGPVTIRATGDGLVAARAVVVVAAPLASVLSASDTVRLAPGDSAQLRPILIDAAGLTVRSTNPGLRYAAVDPSRASVDASGWVKGVTAGVAQVRVSVEKTTVVVPVKVSVVDPSQAFHIDLRFMGPPPSPQVEAAFQAAKRRWETVIRETIGGLDSVAVPTSCYADSATTIRNPRDVVIFAVVDSIDGLNNVLGGASPCIVRRTPSGRWMPLVGRMKFDSADMAGLLRDSILTAVVTHEIGHILGIGTMWTAALTGGPALARQSGFDPRYFGAGGIAASAGLGLTFSSAALDGSASLDAVPLENTGGQGTAYAHWRESVYDNELMTGFVSRGANPLSLLTLQALGDMGYSVATGAAERYGRFFAPAVSSAQLFGRPTLRLDEVVAGPQWSADHRGRLTRIPAPALPPQ